jgi:hypothetical protein
MMKGSRRQRRDETPLDLIESAVHLLREVPLSTHLFHQLASAPFVISLLWYWSDMSRGAYADRRLGPGALLLALLYLVMKTGQSAFCARLRTHVSGAVDQPWTLFRWFRILVTQAPLQPWAFLLFPLSIFPLLMVPVPWLLAFFQGLSVAGDAAQGSPSRCFRLAARHALAAPGQNHGIIGLLILVSFGILIDVGVALGAAPALARILFGIASDFNLTIAAYLNTTFLLAVVGLTYLVLDPILKAIYVLRGFNVDSIQSGDDLRARFNRLRIARAGSSAATLLAIACILTPLNPLQAQPTPASPPTPIRSVEPDRLEQSIRQVLDRPEYTWRGARELSPEEPEDPRESRLKRWLRRQGKAFSQFFERNAGAFFQSLGRLIQRLFGNWNVPTLPTGNSQLDWLGGLKGVLYLLLAAGIGAIAWILIRRWHSRSRPPSAPAAPIPVAIPDLTAETVSADLLPEDEWLRLAAELAGRAEWRLALRAIYLASLAHLAHRQLVRLAPAKSNRDYLIELKRRTRSLPAIPDAFSRTAARFDKVWYGRHEASPILIAEVRSELDTMRRSPSP